MINSPCGSCERKGCGAYHDICPAYTNYKMRRNEIKFKKRAENAIKQDKYDRTRNMLKTSRHGNKRANGINT